MQKRICLVEDNPDNRLLVHAILDDDFDVVEYADGATALAGLRTMQADLVLLDISLPGMDGVEVLAQIRADAVLRRLPVIALTAQAMTGDRERLTGLGFDDYVTKPIADESILFAAIARLIAPA